MRSPNRNRPDYRSSAVGIVTAVLISVLVLTAVPVAAENTASYTLAANGSVVDAVLSLTSQETLSLVDRTLFGTEIPIANIYNLHIINESGTELTVKPQNGVYTFPSGNYTVTYTAPVTENTIYMQYPALFAVTVYLPEPYTTGTPLFPRPNPGSSIEYTENATIVTYANTNTVVVPFYEDYRLPVFVLFLGIWIPVLLIVYLRYRSLKKRHLDPDKYQ